MASQTTSGEPSDREGTASTARPLSRFDASERYPVKVTASASPSSAARCSRSGRSGPSPTTRNRAVGMTPDTSAAARRKTSTPFSGTSRPTSPTTGRPGSGGGLPAAGSAATVGRSTSTRSGATP